jgi:hypothetical protein
MTTAYGETDEDAIDNLIESIAPRTFAFHGVEHVDTQALLNEEKETEYFAQVTLFDPKVRKAVRVQVYREDEQWVAENLENL